MGSFEGRVAVIIGGHSGIGEAISRRLAAGGAHVIVAARRTELVEAVADSIGGSGAVCDITDDAQVEALAAQTLERYGRLDIAVNCAGFQQSTPIAQLTPDRLRAMHAVQLDGAISCIRHLGGAIGTSGGGAFLTMSSLTAHNPTTGLAAYASAKAGVEYATRIAAVEMGPAGVRLNCLAAALVETPMTAAMFQVPQVVQAMTEVTPLGRMGTVDEIAAASVFLCSDDASFITGQVLCVDGGASLLMLPSAQMYADVARRMAEG